LLCVTIVCCIFTVFPPSLSIDPETATDVAVYAYVIDEPSLSTELPGKHSPLIDHPDIAYFSLLLALE
jgi:hypothetical protein